jgi:hypothetical protein
MSKSKISLIIKNSLKSVLNEIGSYGRIDLNDIIYIVKKLRNEKPQNFDMANNKLIVNIFQQTNAIDYILIETGMMKKILLSPNYTSYIVHKVHYTI